MRISELEGEIKACRCDLVSISDALRIFGDPDAYVKPEAMFGRGDLSRVIFDALRETSEGIDIPSLTEIVMRANGFDLADAMLTTVVRTRVGNALYRYMHKGELINRKRPDGTRVWRLAP
ncbi:MAG: hypothetical protein ACLPWS_02790 [Rhodomicrobium sp.]